MTARLDPFLDPALHDVFAARPLVVYDGGAAGSVYCPIESGPCERLRIYGFEPVKRSCDRLVEIYSGNPFVENRQVALADRDGVVTFNEVDEGRETASSLLPRDRLGLGSRSVEVEAVRLDSVPERFGFPPADFIKLDTEGSEALILEAGRDLLDREILGVLTEISFWRRHTGGAVFSDVDRILTRAGFVLFDLQINRSHISTIGGKKDKVRTGDALYLRDFAHLAERMTDATVAHKRAKLLKLVCLCVAWRYLNYALELIDHGRQHGLISSEEFSLLSETFASTTDLAGLIPDFPGRTSLAHMFDVLSSALHRQAKKGIPPVFNGIGNAWVVPRRGERPGRVRIYYPVIGEEASSHIKVIDLGGKPT